MSTPVEPADQPSGKPWWKRKWGIALIVFLVLGGLGALVGEDEPEPVEVAATEAVEEKGAATSEATVSSTPQGPSPGCLDAFAAEAALSDMEDTGELLTPAVTDCATVDDWGAASEANPDALDGVDPVLYLSNICGMQNDVSGDEPLCVEALGMCDQIDGSAGCLEARS